MTTQEESFWKKTTTFTCEDCGYVLPDKHITQRHYSQEIYAYMDYATCPQCGKRAIVLW